MGEVTEKAAVEGGQDEATGNGASPPNFEATLAAAEASIYTTAKWIVAAFAAVAGALITGVSITDIGGLEGDDQGLAVAGAIVAILGVFGVIAAASRVLVSRVINPGELRNVTAESREGLGAFYPLPSHARELRWVVDALSSAPELRAGRSSVGAFVGDLLDSYGRQIALRDELLTKTRAHEELKDEIERATRDRNSATTAVAREAAARRLREATAAEVEAAEAKEDAAEELGETQANLTDFRGIVDRLRLLAQYAYLRERFNTGRVWMFIWAIVATAGVIMFSTANSGASEAPASIGSLPVRVEVTLNDAGQARVGKSIGTDCPAEGFEAIATSRSDGVTTVIVDDANCNLVQTTVKDEEGTIESLSNALGAEAETDGGNPENQTDATVTSEDASPVPR